MTHPPRTILITGANAGIGKEVARQLAQQADTATIYLGCRNESKAKAVQKELEASAGKSIFEIVLIDMTDLDSVRTAVAGLPAPVDAVIMNAGGSGGPSAMELTRDGATQIFATNVLGHVVLLEELLKAHKLTDVALYVGSEAARGIPKFRMARPTFATSSADEFASVIDGTYFAGSKPDTTLAYGQAKYLAALWMSAAARQHPDLRFITMSPGSTSGTEGPNSLPLPMRLAAKYVMPLIGPRLGIAHSLDDGAKRLIDGITDPSLRSGTFYASAASTITGPVVDQADIFADLADPAIQNNANQAIHRFVG